MPLKVRRDDAPSLNLPPMIDIVFLLIIFFMVGTKFSELERKIELDVPTVSNSGALTAAPEKKIVNVHRDGRIVYERQDVDLPALTKKLQAAKQQYSELGVLVRGDAAASHQSVTDVLVACRRAGIRRMAISVQVEVRR